MEKKVKRTDTNRLQQMLFAMSENECARLCQVGLSENATLLLFLSRTRTM